MIKTSNNKRHNEDEDQPDISHIPNDQPIPSRNPDKTPPEIPVDEPDIPGPKDTPIREPNRKPKNPRFKYSIRSHYVQDKNNKRNPV